MEGGSSLLNNFPDQFLAQVSAATSMLSDMPGSYLLIDLPGLHARNQAK